MDEQSEDVSRILTQWESLKTHIEEAFCRRDTQSVRPAMEKGIDLLKQFLLLVNEQIEPNDGEIPFGKLDCMPINLEERLGFITSRPNLYHSYRQLCELMSEQEKQYVKKNIVKKKSSR